MNMKPSNYHEMWLNGDLTDAQYHEALENYYQDKENTDVQSKFDDQGATSSS